MEAQSLLEAQLPPPLAVMVDQGAVSPTEPLEITMAAETSRQLRQPKATTVDKEFLVSLTKAEGAVAQEKPETLTAKVTAVMADLRLLLEAPMQAAELA